MKDTTRERIEQIGVRPKPYSAAELIQDYAQSIRINPGMSLDDKIRRFACIAALAAREIDHVPDMRHKILEHCRPGG